MPYRVEFAPHAARQFRHLPKATQVRLAPVIDALAEDPRPHGVKTLESTKGLYRLREGDYRVVYQVQDDIVLVTVVDVANRREVYKHLFG